MRPYDEAPFGLFHLRLAIGSTGGAFSDGFGLGVVGVALAQASSQLDLSPGWLGLVAAGSLAGLFVGALLTGPIADRSGRRRIFAYNMAALAGLSLLQLFVVSAWQLLALRLIMGLVLGSDYVVSKALLVEFSPRRVRGQLLSTLSIAWAAGYVCAYFVGYVLHDIGPDGWRWMLASGAVPALLILPLRVGMPESPLWLMDHGHTTRAAQIVRERLGADIATPLGCSSALADGWRWKQLLSPAWRRRTLVGCVFFTCQVIPYFAIGTFITQVISGLSPHHGDLGAAAYNSFLLVGSILGFLIVDRISRRGFLVGSFAITAAAMLVLSLGAQLPPTAVATLLAVFACVLSSQASLVYVYLPELFPTELRASGIGLAIAASRLGSAASTFLLPVIVAQSGVRTALGACVAALVFGCLVCLFWAPETRGLRLDSLQQP
jgi:putative MFS transporter